MKPKLKINGTFPFGFENNFIIKLLSKEYDVLPVKENENLFIEVVGATAYLSKGFKKAKKRLLVSGENLKYKLNIFKLNEYITKKTKLPSKKLNKILPRSITNLNLSPLRPFHLEYLKKLSKNKYPNSYAIVPNGLKGKNILNLPNFFLDGFVQNNFNKIENKQNPKIKNKNKFCAIVFSNEASWQRIKFAKKLSKYKKIDFYGPNSYNNADNSLISKSWGENVKFFSQYKFIIAIENSFEKDCITERLPCAMLSNSIPIYRGAPNVKEYFNTKSFINYNDYNKDYDKMIEKIIELDKDDKKYLEFMKIPWLTEKNKKHIKEKQKELRQFLKKVVEE